MTFPLHPLFSIPSLGLANGCPMPCELWQPITGATGSKFVWLKEKLAFLLWRNGAKDTATMFGVRRSRDVTVTGIFSLPTDVWKCLKKYREKIICWEDKTLGNIFLLKQDLNNPSSRRTREVQFYEFNQDLTEERQMQSPQYASHSTQTHCQKKTWGV